MRQSLWKRLCRNIALLGTSGMVLQIGNTGCTSFFANAGVSSMDFCFLLDCNNGALGGLLDFCSPINFTSFVGGADEGEAADPFLGDCPNQ